VVFIVRVRECEYTLTFTLPPPTFLLVRCISAKMCLYLFQYKLC